MNFIKNMGTLTNTDIQERGTQMNLIDENFEQKKTDNSKKIAGIILAIIFILINKKARVC